MKKGPLFLLGCVLVYAIVATVYIVRPPQTDVVTISAQTPTYSTETPTPSIHSQATPTQLSSNQALAGLRMGNGLFDPIWVRATKPAIVPWKCFITEDGGMLQPAWETSGSVGSAPDYLLDGGLAIRAFPFFTDDPYLILITWNDAGWPIVYVFTTSIVCP